jgi:hypothetical protein
MTKLAEQLQQKMPQMTGGARLAVAATDALRKTGRNAIAAHDGFTEKVIADQGMLIALVGRDEIARLALNYLQRVRADMVRGGSSRTDGEAGHSGCVAHAGHAPSPSTPLPGEGQRNPDAHAGHAQPRQSVEGEGGQSVHEPLFLDASPPSPNDSSGGHDGVDTLRGDAPAAVAPKELPASAIAARGASAKVIAVTVLDTFRLSNGVAIGDVYWGSLHRLRNASARDAALLRQLINLGVADPQKKVRDIVSVEQMQLMIQKAAELADAM